jgi:glutaminyl-tRNA synthetase
MSKRKLLQLVRGGARQRLGRPAHADDLGMRRRGYTPEAIRASATGSASPSARTWSTSRCSSTRARGPQPRAPRVMAVLRPLKVVIENYPEGQVEEFEVVNNPEDPSAGTRVPFSRELYIERDDFMEEPRRRSSSGSRPAARCGCATLLHHVRGGREGRGGEVVELRCTYDPATRGGDAPDGRKVKATLHWVSAAHALDAEVRLYDRLFNAQGHLGSLPGGGWPGVASG